MVYFAQVNKWQEQYNPFGYSSGWSALSVAPFKWWAYNVIWSLAWTSISFVNLGLKFMGLDAIFETIAAFSMLGPIGSLATTYMANRGYSSSLNSPITKAQDTGYWVAMILSIAAN